ncbi:chorismate mutase [Vagococcus carniphilus]|uniref:Chorismate mutase n=1 Tax=Vagococcus carniphilus TaxID=218144 RepID=A0A430AVA3_9ENTE|nr:chorismate mutase [Vagococcus carniphilus]QNN73101.1 chorismate mutase [Vagococcus carniphilus]RSU11990.1 chorismate mutase [Vagococcus carniphilus]
MLEKIRDEINQIDQEIVKLLEKRYICVDEVVRIKKENNIPVLDNNREKEVREKIANSIEKTEYKEAIVETFQQIMDVSKEYQKNKK